MALQHRKFPLFILKIGDSSLKNYYKILQIDILSSQEDIKKAYYELAKKYHPDIHTDNPNAEETFKEINEAYAVLSDPDERHQYDQQLKYYIQEPIRKQSTVNQYPKYQPVKKDKSLSRLVAIFIILAIVACIVCLIELNYIEDLNKSSLKPGMTVNDVTNLYGSPDQLSASELKYGSSIILIQNDHVIGWYNAYDNLDIKNSNIDDISDIKIGEDISGIFKDYGYPDTYAKTFLVYYDVVIMYDNNGKVIEIYRIN